LRYWFIVIPALCLNTTFWVIALSFAEALHAKLLHPKPFSSMANAVEEAFSDYLIKKTEDRETVMPCFPLLLEASISVAGP